MIDKLLEFLKQKIKKFSKLNVFKEFILTILYALIFTTFFRSLLFDPFHIPSGSMMPNLIEGDKIFVNKFKYGYSKFSFPFRIIPIENRILSKSSPRRGDVVVFVLPKDENIFYVKRIIGLPGETVEIINNIVYINQIELKQKFNHISPTDVSIGNYTEQTEDERKYNIYHNITNTRPALTFKIPEGHYFGMGDNRDNSLDSRFNEVGFIPEKNIVGRVEMIFFSSEVSPILAVLMPWKMNLHRMFTKINPGKEPLAN